MPPKGKATSAPPPHEEEDDDLNIEHLIEDRMQRLIQQQREEAQNTQQAIMKQIEELITNRLTPSASPAPITAPSDGPDTLKESPAPVSPPASRTYERTPTIPSIDKLKGRSNYPTWIINVESHARHLRLWSVILGQQGTEE